MQQWILEDTDGETDELELSSALGDRRAYLYSPVLGSYSEPKGNSSWIESLPR